MLRTLPLIKLALSQGCKFRDVDEMRLSFLSGTSEGQTLPSAKGIEGAQVIEESADGLFVGAMAR